MLPTLGLKAYDELRRMLSAGDLPPGTQLVNRKLADDIGMSMTPIREAVNRLASEGFVDHVPGAGAFVRRVTPRELSQIYDVREALEPLAAARAAEHATAGEIAELRSIVRQSFAIIREIAADPQRHATRPQMSRWLALERRFHELVFETSRNRWLAKIAADLNLLAFGFSPQRKIPEFLTVNTAVRTWRGHRRVVRALARRDAALAAATVRDHVHAGREELLAHITEHGSIDGRPHGSPPPRPAKPRGRPRRSRGGFTIVELLIVIAIIGMLAGLLFPAIGSIRAAARRNQCANNLVQLGKACRMYEFANGTLPPGGQDSTQLSWRVFILPMIDQQPLYDDFSLDSGLFNGPAPTDTGNREGPNKSVHALVRIPLFHCPDAPRIMALDPTSTLQNPARETYNSHYYGVAGAKGTNPDTNRPYSPNFVTSGYGGSAESGLLFYDSRVKADSIRDGASNTLMIGESAVRSVGTWLIKGKQYDWEGGGDGGNWVRGLCCENRDNGRYPGMAGAKNVDGDINSLPPAGRSNDIPFSSFHAGDGALFARGDASVEFVSQNIAIKVYKAMCTRSGGEADASVVPQ